MDRADERVLPWPVALAIGLVAGLCALIALTLDRLDDVCLTLGGQCTLVRGGLWAALVAEAAVAWSLIAAIRPLLRRVQRQTALADSIVDSAIDGIIVIDSRGIISSFNRSASRIFGYTSDEVVGLNVSTLMPAPYRQEHDGYLERYMRTAEAKIIGIGREVIGRRKDGSTFPMDLAVSEIHHGGSGRWFTGIVRDISTRVQQQQALTKTRDELASANARLLQEQHKVIQAEKLSSLGLLAAGVAHEINNPLAGLGACIKALSQGTVPEPRRPEYFSTAEDAVQRIQQIVRGLLDYSRQQPMRTRVVDAAEPIDACVRLVSPVARKRRVDIVSAVKAGNARIEADPVQVQQALLNVLLNAVQAVAAGGRVGIEMVERPGDVGLTVIDDGPGIPAHLLSKVCDPFFTTKAAGEGTGLGLAVTAGIVEAHGGELEIHSDEGTGTRVVLWFPKENGRDADRSVG